VRNGIPEIAGVPPTVLGAFSRRRADIEAELERRGATSAAAAQVAALQTRRAKDYRVTASSTSRHSRPLLLLASRPSQPNIAAAGDWESSERV
jgi:hypothetical protein